MKEEIFKLINNIDDDRVLKHLKFIIMGYIKKTRN